MVDYFNLKTTCCFTGHRVLKKDFNEYRLKEVIEGVISKGYVTFLIGMAKGFDLKCFETLLEYKRKNKNIEIIACVPCENQQEGYNLIEKQIYNNCLEKADKIITLNKEYINGCMQQRNRFMVDNSSIIIAYMYAERGGTLYTVNYAKKKSKEIIYI